MIFISHRGNINGKIKERENTPEYIEQALYSGYHCEIDVWCINNQFLLGHDSPDTAIDISFLEKHKSKLWVHCKNIQALELLSSNFNCFFHDKDLYTITSKGHIWGNINSQLTQNTICVMPELYTNGDLSNIHACKGICSDNIAFYKESFAKSTLKFKRICILDSYFDYILNFTKEISNIIVDHHFHDNTFYDVVYIDTNTLLKSDIISQNTYNIKKFCIRDSNTNNIAQPHMFEKDFNDTIDNWSIAHYINKQYADNTTFLIQGGYDFRQIKNQHAIYCIFGNVTLSTWKNYNIDNVKRFISSNNCCNAQNIYLQMYTTYNGVKSINTEYTIKTRTDEFYSDWGYFLSQMTDNPNKIICNNIFFRKDSRKLHISDHVLGGKTSLLTRITEKCLDNLVDKERIPNKNNMLLWIAPETWITTSHLELVYDYDHVYNNKGDTKKMMSDNYHVVDIEKMGHYYVLFKHNRRKHIFVRDNRDRITRFRSDIIEMTSINELF
jgi:hypothetical protein